MNDASNPMPIPIAPDGSSPSPLNPGRHKPAGVLQPGDVRTLDQSTGEVNDDAGAEQPADKAASTYGGLRSER